MSKSKGRRLSEWLRNLDSNSRAGSNTLADDSVGSDQLAHDLALQGNPTAATQSSGNNSTRLATTAFVATEVAALVDSAPGALNTLNELAAALGDDANFSTTVTNSIATKAPLASPALTGTPTAPTASSGTNTTQLATTAFVTSATSGLATDSNVANKAPINSPTFTGTPAAPTASAGTNTTQIATTAFVTTAVAAGGGGVAGISSSADATAITIDSSENVGIGETSPSFRLQVKETPGNGAYSTTTNMDATTRFHASEATTGSYTAIQLAANNGNSALGWWNIGSVSTSSNYDNHLVFQTRTGASSYAERMRIDKDGNVGVGTTSPDSALVVHGSFGSTSRIHISSSSNGRQTFDGSGSGLLLTAQNMNTTSKFTPAIQFGTKDVDITTTNPKVGAAINGISSETYSADSKGGMHLAFYTTPNGPGTGQTTTERMRIDSAGNVGIGISPSSANQSYISGAYTEAIIKGNSANKIGSLQIRSFGSTNDTHFELAASDGSAASYIWNGTNSAMVFGTNNSERMRISNAGNVGIGVTSPTATLDVNGTIKLDGNYPVGSGNVALGDLALDAVTSSGNYNVAIGTGALTDSTSATYNVAVGYYAGRNYTTGGYNTCLNAYSGNNTTTGTHNINLGYASGYSTTSGAGNICIGSYAGYSHTTGSYSTYAGYQAGYNNTTGLYNTCVGAYSGYTGTTAQYNVCVGYYAGFSATTNGYHTMLGYYSGSNSTGGAYGNTCVGYNAQAGASGSERHTSIVLGYNTMGVGSGYFCFGTGAGNSRVYNQFGANASWTRVSDQRYKTDIQDNTTCGLAFINDLRPVTFKWKPKSEIDSTLPDYDADAIEPEYSPKMYGLIAQEVKQVLDNHNITDFGGWHKDEDSSIEGISQEMFIYPLIKAVQELSAKVTALENGG